MARHVRSAGFRDVFAVREFRALFAAQILSLVGDWFARIAVTVLVYERTGSAAASALAFAAGLLPWALAGPLLSGLADRKPRRTVMVSCDLIRAALVGLAALPGAPWPVILALIFVAEIAAPPFAAARSALTPDLLPGESYLVGSAITNVTTQLSQVAGFAIGGAVVAVVGGRGALVVDAGTFLVSALILRVWIAHRPLAAGAAARRAFADLRAGASLVFGRPELRYLTLLAWLSSLASLPEGLAAPLADGLGGGATITGALLSANPLGAVLGGVLITRVPADRRPGLLGPLAVLSCAPLLVLALSPGLAVTMAVFFVSGLALSYMLPANQLFVQALPPDRRGQAFGLVVAGLFTGQGAAFIAGGLLAGWLGPFSASAASGAAGVVLAVLLSLCWARVPTPRLPDAENEATLVPGAEFDARGAWAKLPSTTEEEVPHGRRFMVLTDRRRARTPADR